jgi:hypothetical protein
VSFREIYLGRPDNRVRERATALDPGAATT